MEDEMYPDCVKRQWALDCSIAANRGGTRIDKILRDAKKYYGFLCPENGQVVSLDKVASKNDTKI